MSKISSVLLRHLRTVTLGAATVGAATGMLAGCAPTQPVTGRDVGSMAYPAPAPQGQVGTTMTGRTSDVGSMAYPAPVPQGQVGTTMPGRTSDVGSMAYPAPVPQGQVGTTVLRGPGTNRGY